MTKAKASTLKTNNQPASTVATAPASKLPLVKSTKTFPKVAALKTSTALKLGKIDKIIAMMRRPKGATINDLTKATAWQSHSVRGASRSRHCIKHVCWVSHLRPMVHRIAMS